MTGLDAVPVRRVLYVSKTHLDVGFTDLAAAVRRRYLDDFFPRALSVAEELRRRGGPARLRWTTGSWILTEALDAADTTQRHRLESAIEHGDLNWHALPFTLHTEFAERSLVEHGLSLSVELDRRYGRVTRAAKATDVPGHTRALVSLLASAGVDMLHVGVNPVAAVPSVPLQFRWRDEAAGGPAGAPEVSVMYQPGGYGDVQVVEGTDVAVAVDLTGDNVGPRSADEVSATFAALSERFPGAVISAATFDDVAAVMDSVRDTLPVVTAEIGDSWIHGVGSAPGTTAGFRALSRLRRSWIDAGAPASDPALGPASTRLLLVAEHTWGMDQKTHWPDTEHWSASALACVRDDPATRRFESSWVEQRHLLDEFVDELRCGGREDLAADAATMLADATRPPSRELSGEWQRVASGGSIELGPLRLVVGDDGAVVGCTGPDGVERASVEAPLLQVHQQTVDSDDYERWYATYNASVTAADEWWARWDNTKPGLATSGARAASWWPTLTDLRVGEDQHGPAVVIDQQISAAASDPVAVPERYRTVLRWDADRRRLLAELAWWDRPAARWPGVSWWRVSPSVSAPEDWRMVKLGEPVAPLDVVAEGGRTWHVVERLRHHDGVEVELIDNGLVVVGRPRLLVWDDAPVDPASGWHVCLLANLWGTNFPMWHDGAGRCRVEVGLPG